MKQIKWLKVLTVICLVFALSTISTPSIAQSASSKPVELIFSTYLPATHIFVTTMVDWTKKITAASKGRITFKYFYGGTLVGSKQAWEELKNGTCDICDINASRMVSTFPLNALSMYLFYGAKDIETNSEILEQFEKQIPEFAKEWSGAKTLVTREVGAKNLQSVRPVRSLADFKGLKVRSTGSWLKATLSTLGATSVAVASSETYLALAKGIIHANINPDEFLKSFKTAEITKYTTELGLFSGATSRWMMNWNKFNSLSPDLQKIIDDSLPQLRKDYAAMINKTNNDAIAYARSLGPHEVIQFPKADLDKFYALAKEEAVDEAKKADAKGLPGTKMFNLARKLIENQK